MKRRKLKSIKKKLSLIANKINPHLVIKVAILIVIILFAFEVLTLLYSNKSLQSDKAFTNSLNESIDDAISWVSKDKKNILEKPNIALLKMLDECNKMCANAELSSIVDSFMSGPGEPKCWMALIDPNWPVDRYELNETITKESIDNKWTLYAIDQRKADIKPERIALFNYSRWKGRMLNHQLWALIHLRERSEDRADLERLIEHLSDRIAKELFYDTAIVDIYIQKAAFILGAGYPEKIRRRWIERVIKNQEKDGGWNDKWLIFSSGRRPILRKRPTNSHATIQALWLLHQVRYKYPEEFGVVKESEKSKSK